MSTLTAAICAHPSRVAVPAQAARDASSTPSCSYHIDMLVQQNVAAGMSPDEARARGAARCSAPSRASRTTSATRGSRASSRPPSQDIRYGVRNLRRNPGLRASSSSSTMALGIGANTAIFSVVNGVLLRPLPYQDGDKLVVLRHGVGDTVANDLGFSVEGPERLPAVALAQRRRRVPQHVLHAARAVTRPSASPPASCRRTSSTCSA